MLDKLSFLNNLSSDELKIFSGLGLVILVFFAIFILTQLMMIPSRKRAQVKYANYTGRTFAKVLNRYTISVDDGVDENGDRKYKSKCIVSYEFRIGGVTYKGECEGSSKGRDKYETEICYDPSNPDLNCTVYYFDSVTKSHFLSSFIFFVVVFALMLAGIYIFMRVRR